MRHSTGLFISMMISLLVLVSAALWWRIDSEAQQFAEHQHELIQKQAELTADSIQRRMDSLRNRMIAVSLDAFWMKDLEHFSTVEQIQQALHERFKLYFPEMNGFSIADEQGEILWSDMDMYVSDACRVDIAKSAKILSLESGYFNYQPYLHAKPGDYHFDMIFPVLWGEKKLVFFMSFKAQHLMETLKEYLISGHGSYLLRLDKPGLIEVTSEQVRDKLTRPFFLQADELDHIRARVPVNHTLWEVAVVENLQVTLDFWHRLLRDGAIAWGVFVLVWGTLLWFGLTHERRQSYLFNKLSHLSMHDELTGLANRRMLVRLMQQALQELKHEGVQSGLLYLDLNDFKPVNDRYGHDVGDHLLKQFGERLQQCIRSNDLAARLGGDEFVVLLQNLADNAADAEKKLQETSERYERLLSKPYLTDGKCIVCTPSVGTILMRPDVHDVDEILKQGDEAMYRQKQKIKAQARPLREVE
ncbi:GGDEF domain-containing protein [Thiomicrorhabdus cannonii]|uniref:GGDEF domain-containing protein n=1 Tax=Thiomicrorhabdus cannonii TaxID=2748011 RepID=UPI0015BEF19C|nr:GGDEF domain-containing protein [Thiomicrorhabdus cannonii]